MGSRRGYLTKAACVRWPEVATVVAVAVALSTVIRASSLAVLLKRQAAPTDPTDPTASGFS